MPGWWLSVAWVVSAAGWVLVTALWAYQVYLAAAGTRWPAMYIHAFKTFAGVTCLTYFLASILWRDPAAVITFGTYARNIAGWVVLLALWIEAVWRIKENVQAAARGATVQDIPFLREGM